ncbi:Trypsin-like peptidase domain [Rubrobacter radiotolerans]|uniref:Trypsin-like peptidase domain n=1 Tax=Rubrobacter radiotolerans TaxID=42256 RepID=A0A023X5U8_RUBRA|nr:trypsin-like peptidase domain-containing protein [Rubrobacter radiotolerans]AHY47439.1 Trypsin-like peptidase domain [Rubrobacter radiotolerans]MDX5894842.1 trypsin-like peptidase domain-containing protein [Rubrobacter radiotolerans]SMC06885.1 serine protease Do [Rubrobacter radiotolerans DSM 5868]
MTALLSATFGGLLVGLLISSAIVVSDPGSMTGGSGETVEIQQVAPPEGGERAGGRDDVSGPIREVYERYGAGVVSVDVSSQEFGPTGGSGFVVSEDGHIVTNQHVLEGAEGVSVRFSGGDRVQAEIVGEDPSTDVAVLKVEAEEPLLPLVLGNSSGVEVGTPVVAMGNPLNVGLSVTTGIVSATERPIKAPNDYTIDGAVQTDAAISSGSSGGPLLDLDGTVIGVNSQVAAASSGGVSQGVGFAVPVDTVRDSVEQIIETGSVVHGYIGVSMFQGGVDEVSAYTGVSKEELEERFGLPPDGAIVSRVTPDGPSDRAGIEGGEPESIGGLEVPIGDVITSVDGEPVRSPDDVIRVVNEKSPGERMSLTVVRPSEAEKGPRRIEVEVADQPAEEGD